MGLGSLSHPSRKPALNLLPAYQSSGPFLESTSFMVFSIAGPTTWWQPTHFLSLKTFFPSVAPAFANEGRRIERSAKRHKAAGRFFSTAVLKDPMEPDILICL